MTLPDNGSSPGIALYSSPDLKAWKFESWLVKSSDLPPNAPTSSDFSIYKVLLFFAGVPNTTAPVFCSERYARCALCTI